MWLNVQARFCGFWYSTLWSLLSYNRLTSLFNLRGFQFVRQLERCKAHVIENYASIQALKHFMIWLTAKKYNFMIKILTHIIVYNHDLHTNIISNMFLLRKKIKYFLVVDSISSSVFNEWNLSARVKSQTTKTTREWLIINNLLSFLLRQSFKEAHNVMSMNGVG